MSGDGLVTLAEAYQYAFARTLSATTNTVVDPQHPNYDYRLSGRGEVVLTRIRMPAAVIELPAGFERVLLTDVDRDHVIAEIGSQGARRLAVNVYGAGAANGVSAAKFCPGKIEAVAYGPKQRHFGIQIQFVIFAVDIQGNHSFLRGVQESRTLEKFV